MRRRTVIDALQALASLVVLAALLAGVPFALVRLAGWPLPRSVPSVHQVIHSLSGSAISDQALIDILAVLCWLAWAQVVVCTVAELAAWASRRTARAVPLAGFLQPIVRQLVVSAALVLGPVRAPSSPATVPSSQMVAAHVVPKPGGAPSAAVDGRRPEAASAVKGLKSYRVRPRDDLWELAEAHLGDPLRWRELYQLNRGVPQHDGRTLQNADLVRPGWVLRFPADAVGLPDDVAVPAPTVAPSLPSVPAKGNGGLPAACPPSSEPAPVGYGGTKVDAPPPDPAAAKQRPAPPPAVVRRHGGHAPGLPVPAGVLAAGLMAAGVVVSLDRLRRVQQRHRRLGRAIRMPGPELGPTEIALRRAAAGSPADRLDVALRVLAGCWRTRRSAGPPPEVEAVSVSDERIEVLLAKEIAVTSGPFAIESAGRSWVLGWDVPIDELFPDAQREPAPLPALVSIGRSEAGAVMIDLESAGCTALVGTEPAARSAYEALALELATGVWSDFVRVILVGDQRPGLGHLERVQIASSLDEVIESVEKEAGAMSHELSVAGLASTLAARVVAGGGADGWIPTVVFIETGREPSESVERLLLASGMGGKGLAVVALGDTDGADRCLRFEADSVEIEPLGLRVEPLPITSEEAEAIEQLLEIAADRQDVAPEERHTDEPQAAEASADSDLCAEATPDSEEVMILLLGSPQFVGAGGPTARRRSLELLAYLALHPGGVTDEQLLAALWPDTLPSRRVFNQTVYEARTFLGLARDGMPHFPNVTNGIYRLRPTVSSDAAKMEAAWRTSRILQPEDAITCLAEVMTTVRGIPFSGTKHGYEWAHTEGAIGRLGALIADVAHTLATLCLDAGDPAGAQGAAMQGLQGAPGDEVLYRDWMLAADAAGNPAGVEAAMTELCRVLDAVEPYDSLHPETVALYERLSYRHRPGG